MKIGILTFHRAKNYGAVLQAFSLCKFLNHYSECEIIDYRCPSIEKVYYGDKTLMSKIRKIIKAFLFPIKTYRENKRSCKFTIFISREIKLSSKWYNLNTISSANTEYHSFVVGSDQVWNLKITDNDFTYYLNFVKSGKKISYACSFGNINTISGNEKRVIELINTFDFVSVREQEAEDFVRANTVFSNQCLSCDPVFLTSKEEWLSLSYKSGLSIKKPYVLVYEVAEGEKIISEAIKYAKNRKIDVFIIDNGVKKYRRSGKAKILHEIGPYDFLYLISNADMVFTTSFHGLALSLLLNTRFAFELSKEKNNKNSRLITLANIFNLNDYELSKISFLSKYNWAFINKKIEQMNKTVCNQFDILFKINHE